MDVLNYLSKLATGYHSKSISISGIDVKYKFYGKPVPFDPIGMLRELHYKSQEPTAHRVELYVPPRDMADNKLIIGGKLSPVVIADVKLDRCRIKVIRAVTTHNKLRYSRYEFFTNGRIMAVFQRAYDYGKSFDKLLTEIASCSDTSDYNGTALLKGVHTSGQYILGEVFGHTQLWLVFNPEALEAAQQQILVTSNNTRDQKHFQ